MEDSLYMVQMVRLELLTLLPYAITHRSSWEEKGLIVVSIIPPFLSP